MEIISQGRQMRRDGFEFAFEGINGNSFADLKW